jgi:glutathione synthase/RimK-type ligase-like ATP-grasp enzyme
MSSPDRNKILVLTHPNDESALTVVSLLRARGESVDVVDPGALEQPSVDIHITSELRLSAVLRFGSTVVRTETLKAIWFRKPGLITAVPPDPVDRLVLEESRAVLADLWNALDCFWCPAPPARIREMQMKLRGLVAAQAVGFQIPDTLASNEPDAVRAFVHAHDCRVVSKQAGSQMIGRHVPQFGRFTEAVGRNLMARPRGLTRCPMIFQPQVPKYREVRATVVGQAVFAAQIDSQQSKRSSVDWRRRDDLSQGWIATKLPADIERMCVQLVQRLGLNYGAIDLIQTPARQYVFLEINPGGQYGWLEAESDLPISEAICTLLQQAEERRL